MSGIVIDTSIIINYTRGKDDYFKKILKFAFNKKIDLYIPTVVLVEVYVGKEMLQRKQVVKVRKMLQSLVTIELTENIAMLAAKLGRENNLPFDVSDLVIAASTLDLKAELATHNAKHFKLIPKLKICDLRKISTDN